MALTDERNTAVRKYLMSFFGACGITKPEAKTGINVAHDWILDTTAKDAGTTNQAHFSAYLQANAVDFFNKTNADQKRLLLAVVVMEDADLGMIP